MEKGSRYSGEKKVKSYQQSVERKVALTFQQNRSFELHIGITTYLFPPNGTLIVGREVINHPDFKQQAHLFGVQEVKDG